MSLVFRPLVLMLTAAGIGAPLVWRTTHGITAAEPTVYADVEVPARPASYVNANGLREAYEITLVSAWPTPPGESEACNNRSHASLAGTLDRVDQAHYAGRLARRTDLAFCGQHPGADNAPKACSMRLTATDTVEAVAEVGQSDGNGRLARLVWRPMADSSNATASGSCSTTFARALERMHATAVHAIELTLPAANAGSTEQSLDDWGWKVAIE
jgi:hypothetical protein